MTVVAPEAPDPEKPVQWRVILENVSGRMLPETNLFPQFGPGRIESIEPLNCEVWNSSWRCALKSLDPGETLEITATVQHPFRYERVSAGVGVSYVPASKEA